MYVTAVPSTRIRAPGRKASNSDFSQSNYTGDHGPWLPLFVPIALFSTFVLCAIWTERGPHSNLMVALVVGVIGMAVSLTALILVCAPSVIGLDKNHQKQNVFPTPANNSVADSRSGSPIEKKPATPQAILAPSTEIKK